MTRKLLVFIIGPLFAVEPPEKLSAIEDPCAKQAANFNGRRRVGRDRAQLHRDVRTKALFCARDCDLVDNCPFGALFNGPENPFLTDFKRYLSVVYPFIRRVIHNCTQLFYALSEKRRILTHYILY